jgi:NADPH2:quinone reductase
LSISQLLGLFQIGGSSIRLDEVGAPEQLRLVDLPIPEIGDHEALIKVAYAGLLYADTEQRRGTYYFPTPLPWFPGREVAGEVVRVGRDVAHLVPGMRVVALVFNGGGYAEYTRVSTQEYALPGGATVPACEILALPDTVSFSQALVYVVNFRLAHVLIHGYAKIPPGASVLVHGASGGFGSCMTQIARDNDNLVVALCRSEAEAAFCRQIGADHQIDTTTHDYVAAVLDLTAGRGVDFSLNGVGGPTLDRDPLAVATFGEIHAYGYVAGKSSFHPFAIPKSVSLKTFAADDFLTTTGFGDATEAMYKWFRSRPLLDVTKVFGLGDAALAHHWIESGKAIGKIALKT